MPTPPRHALVDADGRLVAKRRIPESVAGFTELTAMLADAGDDPEDDPQQSAQTCGQLGVHFLKSGDAAGLPEFEQLVSDVRTDRRDRHQTFPVESVEIVGATGD